jgi:predicted dinucleotide-binding enzyme
MRLGIIGAGRIGATLGRLWARAGHEILFASRRPEALGPLVAEAGPAARAGTPAEAAAFGEAVLIAVPFAALPDLGRQLAPALGGKVVLETANPYPERDGQIARTVRESGRGTGAFLRDWFPGVRIVRAFNSVWDQTLASEAHREPPRVGIPLASDHPDALALAARLVRDAGFDPVIVGSLDRAKEFDVGTPVYDTGLSGPALRTALGLPPAA